MIITLLFTKNKSTTWQASEMTLYNYISMLLSSWFSRHKSLYLYRYGERKFYTMKGFGQVFLYRLISIG